MLPVLRDNSALAPFTAWPSNTLDNLFDRFFGDAGGFPNQAWSGAPVAMWEDDDHVFVEAEMPGVTDQDVDITVQNGMLFIRGERRPGEGRRYLYNGRSYGRFERVITLPGAVNTDDVQARLADGILTVALPKNPEAKPKRIPLQTS